MRNDMLIWCSILALSGAGCSSVSDPKGPPEPLSALPRALTASEQLVSQSANAFALTLFKKLNEAQPNENVFVSPLSVSHSLGMAMNGAAGTTFDEMRSTLGFGAAELRDINEGYRGLIGLESGLDATGADIRSLPITREEMLRALAEAREKEKTRGAPAAV